LPGSPQGDVHLLASPYAILQKVRGGARDPADIYAFALGKAFSALN
jgi:hypothetical protein